ncbi:helix-turn-helix domain-containing protein [Thiosulfativibrio zosterae]|uniref:Transcriptional regulator n=1 Tax=Thiosulfativibrio zosterae TaxID=2675053 RepID=A0A6F8PRA1_9GAMM|nr:helix-turn-helix domain-containing protein [Thiosulfativibrio zosterae]BBP44557.1 transcriptional regulator [Thiosulfativibrio zosterae]
MNGHTEVQIIQQGGIPAFAVLPIADYERLRKSDDGKRNTLPHAVVKMNLEQGYSLLKAWREYFGMSQSELATKTQCTQAQIANYESNKSIPRGDTLLRLSQVLGVNADLLMETDDVEN